MRMALYPNQRDSVSDNFLSSSTIMIYEISQKFFFDAAHTLRREIEADSSRRIHGHTYNAEIFFSGALDAQTGMVVDLGLVRLAMADVREQLDHCMLDDVPGLGPATLENLCAYIWARLSPAWPALSAVRVWRESVGDACLLRPGASGIRTSCS